MKGNRQDPLSRSITCCSGQNHKIKYCYFLLCGQLVEKPGCALCSNRVSGIFREGKAEKQEAEVVIPLPCSQFFKFMAANLSFTSSVPCITHSVFLFCIRKDPLNGFFPAHVELRVSECISGITCLFLVALPDMPLHGLYAVLGMGTQFSGRAVGAYLRSALVFSVSIAVFCAVFRRLASGTDETSQEKILTIRTEYDIFQSAKR